MVYRYLVEPQELVAARSWRFESSLPHHSTQSLRSFARGRPRYLATEANGVLPALSEAFGRIEGSERTAQGSFIVI